MTLDAGGVFVTEQEFATLLELGHETNGVDSRVAECRPTRPSSTGVIRAVLGMANRRTAAWWCWGLIRTRWSLRALTTVRQWFGLTSTGSPLESNEFASPSVNFNPEALSFRGRSFVILRVEEFSDIPILCRRDFQAGGRRENILRRRALLCNGVGTSPRPRRYPPRRKCQNCSNSRLIRVSASS